MGILNAVMVATTMLLVLFAWQLTFELEVLEERITIDAKIGT